MTIRERLRILLRLLSDYGVFAAGAIIVAMLFVLAIAASGLRQGQ